MTHTLCQNFILQAKANVIACSIKCTTKHGPENVRGHLPRWTNRQNNNCMQFDPAVTCIPDVIFKVDFDKAIEQQKD